MAGPPGRGGMGYPPGGGGWGQPGMAGQYGSGYGPRGGPPYGRLIMAAVPGAWMRMQRCIFLYFDTNLCLF